MAEAITYDDVLLVPSYNHWESRKVVDISMTDKSEKLKLDLPVMTSNMDTITEGEMANYIGDKGRYRCFAPLHDHRGQCCHVQELQIPVPSFPSAARRTI